MRRMWITIALLDDQGCPVESKAIEVPVNDTVPAGIAVESMTMLIEDALREAEYEVHRG